MRHENTEPEACPACEAVLRDDEHDLPECCECDRRLERLLAAWLDFAAIRDE